MKEFADRVFALKAFPLSSVFGIKPAYEPVMLELRSKTLTLWKLYKEGGSDHKRITDLHGAIEGLLRTLAVIGKLSQLESAELIKKLGDLPD